MACGFGVPRRTVYPVKAPLLHLLVELPHEAATWSGCIGLKLVNITPGLTSSPRAVHSCSASKRAGGWVAQKMSSEKSFLRMMLACGSCASPEIHK